MIKEIRLGNFKAFNETQTIPLRPITLLYGPNSAGKSTIIQSLLLLEQSQSESDMEYAALIPKGKQLNLGNYREMVYAHNLDSMITFTLSFDLNQRKYPFMDINNYAKEIRYEIQFCYNEEAQQIKVDNLALYCNNEPKPFLRFKITNAKATSIFRAYRLSRNTKVEKQNIYEIVDFDENSQVIKAAYAEYCTKMEKRKVDLERQLERLSRRRRPIDDSHVIDPLNNINEIDNINKQIDRINGLCSEQFISEFKTNLNNIIFLINSFLVSGVGLKNKNDESENKSGPFLPMGELFDIDDFVISISYNLHELLESIVYLGPLRDYPERHYIFSGVSPTGVGKSGKYTSDLLFLNNELTQKVNLWLNEFGIDYEMVINKIQDEDISDVYSMRLVDKMNNISVSPLDVGFGISQILPIIVQGLLSKNSTILIEQPEIHIHPRLQTVFGSFLTESIKSGNQFIVETHSEHILLRIQKLIRQKKLSNNDVSVIYVDRQKDGSKCLEIRLD